MLPYIKISRLKQQGIALLLVLVFLQLFALLGLAVLRKNSLQIKQIGALWQKQQIRVNAEWMLAEAEHSLSLSTPSCLVSAMDPSKITHQDLAWWQAASCAGNFQGFQYYYLVEFLGNDNCAFIKGNNKNIAYFYRVSLLMLAENSEGISGPRVILQSLFLKKGAITEICKLPQLVVEEGRQDWNELI